MTTAKTYKRPRLSDRRAELLADLIVDMRPEWELDDVLEILCESERCRWDGPLTTLAAIHLADNGGVAEFSELTGNGEWWKVAEATLYAAVS